jgi:hypothetical protein
MILEETNELPQQTTRLNFVSALRAKSYPHKLGPVHGTFRLRALAPWASPRADDTVPSGLGCVWVKYDLRLKAMLR